ncbi:VOC family protein [Streptomyces sp. 3MP-14]|uniref:VOC family protein n=1 Tax=Streptomyces mimosae TaxID=2586635 RepID=A0A5N6AKZ6_9ACTN|nr:VOC family protein [Streptomyces mimosae]KAB8178249.1 VOC family protein [Streptomyces sp. 3MP-14]
MRMGLLVLGADDVERAAAFWTEALGFVRRPPRFPGEVVTLQPRPGEAGVPIALPASGSPPEPLPRLHLDLLAESAEAQEAEVARLVALGATRVDWCHFPPDPDFVVLADPEGNRFCVVDESHVPVELGSSG